MAATLIGTIVALVIGIVLNALVIWIVSKLNLGLRVSGFGGAILAAVVISLVNFVLALLLTAAGLSVGGGILGPLVTLIVAAVVLLISDKIFWGAILAAIAMGIVNWLIHLLLNALGMAVA